MHRRSSQSDSRIPELDGIRGLAILLVVLYHYYYLPFTPTHGLAAFIRNSTALAWTGVDLFFVLSGFLIGGILIDHRDSENYFKSFYIRRICRILPIYFLWLALFFIVARLFSASASTIWYAMEFGQVPHCPKWGYFLFLQNFWIAKMNDFGGFWIGATWSLCIEEHFYLLAPLAIWLLPPRKLPAVLVLLVLSTLVLRFILYLYCPSIFLYPFSPCRADGLLLGVLCACLVRNVSFCDWAGRQRQWLYLTFALLFCGMVYLTVISSGKTWTSNINSFEIATGGFTWIALFYACFILIVVTAKTGVFARATRNRGLRHFAAISYCIYLIHVGVQGLMYHWILGNDSSRTFLDVVANLLAFLMTWLLAVLSWRFLEKPLIDWGHSFVYRGRKMPSQNEIPEKKTEPD